MISSIPSSRRPAWQVRHTTIEITKGEQMRAVDLTVRAPACLSLAATSLMLTPAQAQQVSGDSAADQPSIQEVVVTGSYLRTSSQGDLASPTQVIDAEALARTGAPGLDRIIN